MQYHSYTAIRMEMIARCFEEQRTALIESKPKLSKKKLDDMRHKLRSLVKSDIKKACYELLNFSSIRHLIVYKQYLIDVQENKKLLQPLYNYIPQKEVLLKQVKQLAGVK